MKKTKANRKSDILVVLKKSGNSDGGKELITDGTASEGHIAWTQNQGIGENKTYSHSTKST
ncbi:hypothetical protein JCM15060_00030 [Halanaerobaculum tunisiense]